MTTGLANFFDKAFLYAGLLFIFGGLPIGTAVGMWVNYYAGMFIVVIWLPVVVYLLFIYKG